MLIAMLLRLELVSGSYPTSLRCVRSKPHSKEETDSPSAVLYLSRLSFPYRMSACRCHVLEESTIMGTDDDARLNSHAMSDNLTGTAASRRVRYSDPWGKSCINIMLEYAREHYS